MKNTLETRLGIFFALALVATILTIELIGGLDFFKGGYRVRALFDNVQELKPGDPVRMAGVDIGHVEDVALGDTKVEVTLKLDKRAKVRTDSRATIKFTGLLGQNVVAITFGTPTAPLAEEGATLETTEQTDLSTLMAKLEGVAAGVENMTRNFSGENFQNLLGPFTDFLKENSPRLTAILGNMQTISSQIADGKGTVGKLIADETLYTTALGAVTNLDATAVEVRGLLTQAKSAVGDMQSVIGQINTGQGTLGKLARDEALYRETTSAMTNLREIFEKINRGDGSVGKLVNDESFYKNAKMTLQKVEKATEGLEDQGPLSILGTAFNSLF
jgi:phospholipid/cholesterol/gamma-HCH transport system substrate-binding protein